ncbi:MAG TPA: glycosyltransferase [Caulobacteraceae bacterium]
MSEPLVTVVVSPREGHFMAERSLLSVLADDAIPFDLIYVDFAAPPKTEAAIQAQAAARNFKLVRRDGWMAPSAARKSVLSEVKTKYVAFIDNDTLVERGCLETLVACAEETGAGLVCPLYIQAGGGTAPTIHMAGGMLAWAPEAERGLVAEGHRLAGEPLERAAGMTREKVGYTEYHYVLGRMDLLSRPGAISDDVLLVHEHIDLALFAREQGMDVVFEPAARVTYVAFDPRPLADIAFYRQRWDVAACDRSLAAFARRWPIADRAGMIEPMIGYAASRLQEVDLRRPGPAGADLAMPMGREELAQIRFSLREQAIARGYGDEDVRSFEVACDLATLLFDGLYRPDGRPFLSHVIGTASALVRYEAKAQIVQSGLLHAAYSHRPAWMTEAELSATLRERFGGDGLIVAQPNARAFLAQEEADCGVLNMVGAATMALLAANEVDMRLSGEYRATGRPADLTPAMLDRIGEALSCFGLDGLARSAGLSGGEVQAWPVLGAGVQQASFRLDAPNRRMLPVN